MKHNLTITIILIAVFLISQLVGLVVVNRYMGKTTVKEGGVTKEKVTFKELPYNITRPEVKQTLSFVYVLIAVIIGTLIALALVRTRKPTLWKLWYAVSVFICLSVSFSVFIGQYGAFWIALFFALFKTLRPSVIIHNITEVFVYAGIAAIFVPIMNVLAGIILLIFISIYDAYAVWKSKHMIKLAKFQTKTGVFAGLLIPYIRGKIKGKKKIKVSTAILGGGDVAFPLIFAGVVMRYFGVLPALFVVIFTTIALSLLLFKSKQNRYYPAMPFLTAGSFVGFIIGLLIFV